MTPEEITKAKLAEKVAAAQVRMREDLAKCKTDEERMDLLLKYYGQGFSDSARTTTEYWIATFENFLDKVNNASTNQSG